MKEELKKNSRPDWALLLSIIFWILLIAAFITIISSGKTKIPLSVLEVIEASASRENLIIAHRKGDPVRFANTKCMWMPDKNHPNITIEAGSLVLAGTEGKQGRVSKLESGEMAKLQNDIFMSEGSVGRISVLDLMSGQQIFSQLVSITK